MFDLIGSLQIGHLRPIDNLPVSIIFDVDHVVFLAYLKIYLVVVGFRRMVVQTLLSRLKNSEHAEKIDVYIFVIIGFASLSLIIIKPILNTYYFNGLAISIEYYLFTLLVMLLGVFPTISNRVTYFKGIRESLIVHVGSLLVVVLSILLLAMFNYAHGLSLVFSLLMMFEITLIAGNKFLMRNVY